MKKTSVIVVILILVCLIVFASCKDNVNNNRTVTVTDMVGREVSVTKNPKKVACVSRTTYDLLVAFGLGDKIDGAYKTIYDNPWTEVFYPQSKNEYRYQYEESYETFITRGVDLVFAPEKYIADGLAEHGITAIVVSLYGNPTFDDMLFYFADLTKTLWDYQDIVAKVDAWKSKVSTAINDITTVLQTKNLPEQTLFYVRGDKNKGIGYTDTAGSFTEFAYRMLGFKFLGAEFETNKPGAEEICSKNPDYFVIGGIYQNTLLDILKTAEPYVQLDSVKNGRYCTIPVGLTMFEQLNALTPIFFCDQANKIYPEYFSYDVATMLKESVKEYFGTDLTDSDIQNIFSGKDKDGNNLA